MKLTDLHKGDIFQDGKHSWDGVYRFHSCSIKGKRILIHLMGVFYAGDVETAFANSFTWRDIEHEVYIPVFYKCEFKRKRGLPCLPVNNRRVFYPSNLNPINISNKFCDRDDYWYEYANLLF